MISLLLAGMPLASQEPTAPQLLGRFVPTSQEIGLDFERRIAVDKPTHLRATFRRAGKAGEAQEQLSLTVLPYPDIDRSIAIDLSGVAVATGTRSRDVSAELGAKNCRLLTAWQEGQGQVGFVLDGYVRTQPGRSAGWHLRVQWTMHRGAGPGGTLVGRVATRENLQVAANLINGFVRNAQKTGWPVPVQVGSPEP